ncbi:ADP-ribose glycohydrolase MACROD1 isoform X3 [Cheilinus undulatus]|uniref:ADP-ribose glycohydrolase MACROD1 isoform X3 n=1 Tax=Cheilinus undulatus TaxID=241271 RepID=UPI001BD5A9B3|nr:ADP-ribose glycohydrolase MACROD1 isoform X3 [Cheilinus undulatus]
MRRDCLRSPVKVPKAKLLHGVADIYLFDTDVTRTVVLPDSGMALQMSALFSHIRAPLSTGPLSRIRADFQGAGVKFKHILSPGSPQLGGKPATSPVRGHINAPLRAERFSTTAAVWKSSQGSCPSSPTGRRGWLGKFALGAALGVSTATLVQCLHTGTLTAMAQKVNLNSAEGEWKETKEFLLSLAVKDRRQYYRTSSSVPLEDIPLWTPAAGGTGKPVHQRNEKLDQKISLYSGDITKLEIDAIVNAANKTLLGGGGDVIHTVGPIAQGGVGEVERKALRSCYKNSLTTATRNGARSVAFPCISTGIYGYPPEQAVHEALATVREYLDEHHDKLDRVIFCVFLPTDKELYLQNLPLYFPAEATVKSKL